MGVCDFFYWPTLVDISNPFTSPPFQIFSTLQPELGAGEVKLLAQHLLQWQKQCAGSKDDTTRSEFRWKRVSIFHDGQVPCVSLHNTEKYCHVEK